jgi:hypothetical protein
MEKLQSLAQPPSVRTVRMPDSPAGDGEWADLGYMAGKTGFDAMTLRRLIEAGDLPAMQLAGSARTFSKVPRRLVDEAYAAVMHQGGRLELREFCRQWKARNSAPGEVA